MTKKELVELLVREFRNGDMVDLSGLDFSQYKVSVKINGMEVSGSLFQCFQQVSGKLYQHTQRVGSNLIQSHSSVGGDLFQSLRESIASFHAMYLTFNPLFNNSI